MVRERILRSLILFITGMKRGTEMKQYYAERNGLIQGQLSIDLDELLELFKQTYDYFERKGCFEAAYKGVTIQRSRFSDPELIIAPTMAPSPQVFFEVHLQSNKVWPIYEYFDSYEENTLFSVIEMLYDHIALYDYQNEKLNKDEVKEEFVSHINKLLKAYRNGYYLVPSTGFIMEQPNQALKEQLAYNGEELPEDVFERLKSASQNYYRFDADEETKKKAIASLADVLENVRSEAKELFNSEFNIPKNEHDKLIFEIVNGYNIRHNNQNQKTDYSKDIWYDWMMQYYTSTIIAFYKVKHENENPLF